MTEPLELSPQEVKSRLENADQAVLIDVREPQEIAISRIEQARFIPMQSIPAELQRIEAMADDADLMVICHHGVRSLQVVSWLREHGVNNCYSVMGGIDRWSREVDPNVPQY